MHTRGALNSHSQNLSVSVTMELQEPFDHITEFHEQERCSVIKPKPLTYFKNNYRCLLFTFASVVSKLLLFIFPATPQRNKTNNFLEPTTFCDKVQDDFIPLILSDLAFLKKLPTCEP